MTKLFPFMSSENISLTVSQITTITYADILIYSHWWINLVDKPNEILQGIPVFDMDQMPPENLKLGVTFSKNFFTRKLSTKFHLFFP